MNRVREVRHLRGMALLRIHVRARNIARLKWLLTGGTRKKYRQRLSG